MGLTDDQLETLYKSAINVSHYAGLRAVFDAGWNTAQSVTPTSSTPDASLIVATPVTTPDTIATP